jgi:hypothetical protein
MKKYGHFSRFTVPVGLSACLCTASAQADTFGPAVNLQPKYKVEAVSFHCNSETGYDEPWFDPWISDEVRVGIGTPAIITISKVFGDVDSGETWSFEPDQSCIYPIMGAGDPGVFVAPASTWTCLPAGTPGPISFTVVMAEEDSGFFHEFGTAFHDPIKLPDGNDDVIGRFTVEVTPQELAAVMPNVGDTFDETITLGPCFDERADEGGCVKGTGIPDPAEYTFTYRFTRLPVVP